MTDETISKSLKHYSQPIIFLGGRSVSSEIIQCSQAYFQLSDADLVRFSPDEGVKDLREKISQFNLKPHSGQKRLFLVLAADELNHEQANTLLKTLEEPPPYAVILLFAQTLGRVLPTIKSRCHRVVLSRREVDSRSRLVPHLVQGSFAELLSFLKPLTPEDIKVEIRRALADIKQKSFNGDMPLYRKLARCLIKVESTNVNPKLLLEEVFIWRKTNARK